MPVTTFAAIDVGADCLVMSVYEISRKYGIRQLDCLRHDIMLGMGTYRRGGISAEMAEETCVVLQDFAREMAEYKVSGYLAYATSAVREAGNNVMLLEQIRLRTGIKVKILSNSEERFLNYKALAGRSGFNALIADPTLLIDIGAGSIQLYYLDHGVLQFTQNIKTGYMRVRALLSGVESATTHYAGMVGEYLNNDLSTFSRLFLSGIQIKHIIALGEHLPTLQKALTGNISSGAVTPAEWQKQLAHPENQSNIELSKRLGLSPEETMNLIPTILTYDYFLRNTGAELLHFSTVNFCEGMAWDYAEKKELLPPARDYTNDILSATRSIAKRYHCFEQHTDNVEYVALNIFDCIAKSQGLSKRDRLLMQIAIILHNCGEYVNMNKVTDNSYTIVFFTEIIGLTHQERELVANIVRYSGHSFPRYTAMIEGLDREVYLKVAKLMAVFRLANILDKSHLQKFREIHTSLKENRLEITVSTDMDITLERGLFPPDAKFFEEVFGITPVLKQKRGKKA